MKFIILTLLFITTSCYAEPDTFRESKKILKKIYGDNVTFYCNCSYKGKKVDKQSCGYEGKKKKDGKEYYKKRSNRIEWLSTPKNILFA